MADSYDNALAATIIGLYKAEFVHRGGPWNTKQAVEQAVLEWVTEFNHHRLLVPLGHIPPAELEANYHRQSAYQVATVSPKPNGLRGTPGRFKESNMAVHEFPFRPSLTERSAWRSLVGPTTQMPATKAAMLEAAREVYDRRIKQAGINIDALSGLTAAAETLGLFGGAIDTQKTELFGQRPVSLGREFKPVEAVKIQRMGARSAAEAGNDTPE